MTSGHLPDLAGARFRAESLGKLRSFFSDRQILEVETPVLSRGISLDSHIDVFAAEYHPLGYARAGAFPENFYLQTSPEPHMKRLLCAGFPDIYQVSKSFRNGELGSRHNPEFSMLEWYRKGFSLEKLMEEVEALCHLLAGPRPVVRRSYREVFKEALDLDPLEFELEALLHLPALTGRLPQGFAFTTKSDALGYLMAHIIEPSFPPEVLTFVNQFPAEQAAQARILDSDPRLAHRFEVYSGGMELGNGYLELLNPIEYAARFDEENGKRRAIGKPELPKDRLLLSALEQGLPPCSGVAMGFDRLLMLGYKQGEIGSVLNFTWETC